MAGFNAKVERRIRMQQLIDLVGQNASLGSKATGMFLGLGTAACLILLGSLIANFISSFSYGKHRVAKTVRDVGIIASVLMMGFAFYKDYTSKTKIKTNNVKIEQIKKSVINSQSSKYPFCISMEENDSVDSNQTLVFFHNKQDAINFIQKNKDDKNIFVTNYLKSHDSTSLKQGSNQTIENNFDCMRVEHTKKALTQMVNSIEQNDN